MIGGVHGNEPAGVAAIERVLDLLRQRETINAGWLVGVVGNRRALAAQRRFIVRDLNRHWSSEQVLENRQAPAMGEDLEQQELLDVFEPLIEHTQGPVFFIDLHTSSGLGPPFCCMSDVLRNRPVAFGVPVPVVFGLEEVIDGSMLGYLCDRGHVGVAFEGGAHEDPSTVDHLESILWLTLVNVGMLDRSQVPDVTKHFDRLATATRGLPRALEIRHREVVNVSDDQFVMEPGYSNFDHVEQGQRLATDGDREIRATEDALLMLPRYQGLGDDGFFLARPISTGWLTLSAATRRLQIDRLLPYLLAAGGVHPEPPEGLSPDHFVLGRAEASRTRYERVMTSVFHLLGYRRVRSLGGRLVFSRRRPSA
jgi:succinylglutamate desuccinylase